MTPLAFSKELGLTLAALSEQVYLLANTGRCELPEGFSEPVPIRMPKNARPFLIEKDPLDIWGLSTVKDGTQYLAFRGTQITSGVEFLQEWELDGCCLPMVRFGAGHVHLGFHGAWAALSGATAELRELDKPLVITGHSLGAALATLCWSALGGSLVTFAGPRVGDPDFAAEFWKSNVTRVINAPDVVPRIPTDPPFRHGGIEVLLDGLGSPWDLKLAHCLDSYIAGMQKIKAPGCLTKR